MIVLRHQQPGFKAINLAAVPRGYGIGMIGIALAGVQHDTLLQSYVLESHKSHDMDNLAERHLSLKTTTYDEITGKGSRRIPFEQVSVETNNYSVEQGNVWSVQRMERLYAALPRDRSSPVASVFHAGYVAAGWIATLGVLTRRLNRGAVAPVAVAAPGRRSSISRSASRAASSASSTWSRTAPSSGSTNRSARSSNIARSPTT